MEPIADYIRANADRYTRETLTDALLRQGHSAEAIAAAWAEIDAERARPGAVEASPPAAAMRARQSVLSGLAILLALAAFVAGMFGILAGSNGRPLMYLYAVLFPIQIVLVTRWIYGRIRASDSLRSGDAAATVGWLIVPPVALVAILGICVAYSGSFGCYIEC